MANWKCQVSLSDLFDLLVDEDIQEFYRVRDETVRRLRLLPYAGLDEFDDIVALFEFADDLDEYNSALDDLYDFGDEDHRLWVGTF